jgi:hypothetical protein
MKTLLLSLSLLLVIGQANAAQDSEKQLASCFKEQLELSIQNLDSYDSKTNMKLLNDNIKQCKNEVKSIVKAEKESKRQAKLVAQIAKLQSKLTTTKK